MKKKNKKSTVKYYHLDMFDSDFLLVLGKYEELEELLFDVLSDSGMNEFKEMYDKSDIDNTVKARQFPMKGGGSIIWTKEDVPISVLVHEVFHAVFNLMDKKGIRYCSDSEEIYSYAGEAIFKNLVK